MRVTQPEEGLAYQRQIVPAIRLADSLLPSRVLGVPAHPELYVAPSTLPDRN